MTTYSINRITLTQLAHKEGVTKIRVKNDVYSLAGDPEIELYAGRRLIFKGVADADEVREFIENHSK